MRILWVLFMATNYFPTGLEIGEDGQIMLFCSGMSDNPTGYLALGPPSHRPPVTTDPGLSVRAGRALMPATLCKDPDGNTRSVTLPDAATDTEIEITAHDVPQIISTTGLKSERVAVLWAKDLWPKWWA